MKKFLIKTLLVALICLSSVAAIWTTYQTVTSLTGTETFLTTTASQNGNEQISANNLQTWVLGKNSPIFFVSPSGNDANNGSYSYPFLSIGEAVNSLSNIGGSGTIYLIGGPFYNQSINAGLLKNFHVTSYTETRTKIINGDALTSWTNLSGNIYYTSVSGQTSNDVAAVISEGDTAARNMGQIYEYGTQSGMLDHNQVIAAGLINPAQPSGITNRNDNYVLSYHTNEVNLSSDGEWAYTNSGAAGGGTVYVVFSDGNIPSGRTVYVPSTNSFIYNCSGLSNEVEVTGIEVDFCKTGIDCSYSGKTTLSNCKFSGCYWAVYDNQGGQLTENNDEFQQNDDSGNVIDNGVSFNADGIYVHDNNREGSASHYNCQTSIKNSYAAFNFIGGFYDFCSSGTYANITTISNSYGYALEANDNGYHRSVISGSKFIGDQESIAVEGTNQSVIVSGSGFSPFYNSVNNNCFFYYEFMGSTNYGEFDGCYLFGANQIQFGEYYVDNPGSSIAFNAGGALPMTGGASTGQSMPTGIAQNYNAQGGAGTSIMQFPTTGTEYPVLLNPAGNILRWSTIHGYKIADWGTTANGTGGITDNVPVYTRGVFASIGIITNAITSTGWTNYLSSDVRVFNLQGTGMILTNFTTANGFTIGTISVNNDDFILHTNEAIIGTGVSGIIWQ